MTLNQKHGSQDHQYTGLSWVLISWEWYDVALLHVCLSVCLQPFCPSVHLTIHSYLPAYLPIYTVCDKCVCHRIRTEVRGQLLATSSSFPPRVPGTELRWSAMAALAYTCRAVLPGNYGSENRRHQCWKDWRDHVGLLFFI